MGMKMDINGKVDWELDFVLFKLDGDWESARIEFYAPSQHTFDGKHYDLEMIVIHSVATNNDYLTSNYCVYFDRAAGGD